MKNKLSISIGIPAHNEEQNIGDLLSRLISQTLSEFEVFEIAVLSDGSTDGTENIVKELSIQDKRIKLYSGKRVGKSRKISSYARNCDSDILILLDADVGLQDKKFIKKIAEKFRSNTNLGLLGICDLPFPTDSRVEQVINENICIWNEVKEKVAEGKSIHNVHGCAYAMSKKLFKQLDVPKIVFNDDEYAYLANKLLGLEFDHDCSIKIYYQPPTTISDFLKQSARFGNSRERTYQYFGPSSAINFEIPSSLKKIITIKHACIHPVNFIGAILLQITLKVYKKWYTVDFNKGYWNRINSTKLQTSIKI